MPDALEPGGQHMQQEAPHKLYAVEFDDTFSTLVIRSGLVQRLANTSRTVSATFSGVNPKCLNSTGAGADSP